MMSRDVTTHHDLTTDRRPNGKNRGHEEHQSHHFT